MSDYAQIISAARALVENFDAHEAERGPCNVQFVNPASGKLEDNHLMMPVPLLVQLRTAVRELPTRQVDGESHEGEMLLQLMAWHSEKVKILRSIQDIVKGGTTVKVESHERGFTLTHREAAIYRLGMETVLVEIGKLPLTSSVSSPDDADDDGEGAQHG